MALGVGWGGTRTQVDNFILEYVPEGAPIRHAHHVLEEKLSGIVYVDLLLDAGGDVAEPWKDPQLLAAASGATQAILAEPRPHRKA